MDIRKMFDNAFYNGGYEELTMDEQAEYIEVLKDVTGFANFFYVDESYTLYVPFVAELFPGYVSNYIMVRFFTILSLVPFSEIFWPKINYTALLSILLIYTYYKSKPHYMII